MGKKAYLEGCFGGLFAVGFGASAATFTWVLLCSEVEDAAAAFGFSFVLLPVASEVRFISDLADSSPSLARIGAAAEAPA